MGYTDSLAHFYDMSTPVALPDLGVVGGNPGTGANIASNPVGIHGKSQCAEMNGTTSLYNLGDILELNAVSAFTIAFWMRQDVLDAGDTLFSKVVDAATYLRIIAHGDGNMYFGMGQNISGYFDYSTVIAAGSWHHLAFVFNGAGIGDAGRQQIYVDGNAITLAFLAVAIPAQTGDWSSADAVIGEVNVTLDGLLDAFAIFTRPLTNLQVSDFKLATAQGRI